MLYKIEHEFSLCNLRVPHWHIHYMNKENKRGRRWKQASSYLLTEYASVLEILPWFPFDIE